MHSYRSLDWLTSHNKEGVDVCSKASVARQDKQNHLLRIALKIVICYINVLFMEIYL